MRSMEPKMASTDEETQYHSALFERPLGGFGLGCGLDGAELLRYRSNLLGADLRLTNFAGGNTSSKVFETDPLTGRDSEVIWVKGSGGDLGSMKRSGLASLYLEKLYALEHIYRGVEFEDEMADMYPLCTFRNNPVAASIDTPLHGFLRSSMSIICIPTGGLPSPLRRTVWRRWRNSTSASGIGWYGFRGSGPASSLA